MAKKAKFKKVGSDIVSAKTVTVEIKVANKKYAINMPTAEAVAAIKAWRGKYPSNELDSGDFKDYQDGVIITSANPIFSKPIHERLVQLRKQKDLTQVELAQLVGTTQANISSMEAGRRSIGKEIAVKLGKALGVEYHLLL